MKTLLDILQGIGVSAAAGLRPFLPTLAVGGLASADAGVDFDGTAFSFLESPWFLLAVAVALVITTLLRARIESTPAGRRRSRGSGWDSARCCSRARSTIATPCGGRASSRASHAA